MSYESELEDVILAYLKYAPPQPVPADVKFTLRQRLRMWLYWRRCDIEQWIHDHLDYARCDC